MHVEQLRTSVEALIDLDTLHDLREGCNSVEPGWW